MAATKVVEKLQVTWFILGLDVPPVGISSIFLLLSMPWEFLNFSAVYYFICLWL
jgi:energy-converting hydrogenase Eha subunit E